MVKHKGLCPSLKKSVEFDVKEIIEIPTKRGVKYQVKGDYEGRTCSTFCSKAKAMELKKALGLDVMEAETEDGTGQAHQEEGVSPIENNVQPLAQGQEPMEAMPVQETVSTPITNTSIGVEPLENLDLTDADALNNMATDFDKAPQMVADIEIAPSEPAGDGRSIGNIRPMNEDVPLHAESEDGTGQAHQEEGVSPIENNVQPLAQGQEPMEVMPVQETVSTPITNTSIGVEPIDNLGLDGADAIGSMTTEFDDAPEILANFQIGMMQPFGEGRSIGNNTPMNPDVPLHAEEYKAEAEITLINPLDETTLTTPPPVCFVEKIPPVVWENLSVLEKIHYAETGDERVLVCPQCGISKADLREVGGYCAVSDPEGDNYISSVDCPYQKHFAPSHWIDAPIVVGHITDDEVELSERLPADVDMPPMTNPQKDLQTMIIPYFVWDKIYTQFTGGIKAEQDLSGLNYVLKYHGMMKPQLDNAIEVAEGEYDIMFGAERYQAQVFKAENNQGYYIDAETVIPLTKKGKTPRELKEDKDIIPEESLEFNADYYDMEYIILEILTDEQLEEEYGDYMRIHGIGRKELPQQLEDDYRTDEEAPYLREKYLEEEYHAEYVLAKKGKVRTMSGKPHTPRELKEDKDITPEEALMRKEMKAETFDADDEWLATFYDTPLTLNELEKILKDAGIKVRGRIIPTSILSKSGKGYQFIFDYKQIGQIYGNLVPLGILKTTELKYDAETFDVEFDDWAEQEMLTHGKDVSFKEWAKEEGKKHGDMDLTDWAEEEEESHDKRYEAEDDNYVYFMLEGRYSPDEDYEGIANYFDIESATDGFNRFKGHTFALQLLGVEEILDGKGNPIDERKKVILSHENDEENYEAEVVQYDVLKGKPSEGGVEYAEYISIHDSANEAEKEARRESKNIAEDEAIYVVEERFDDETLESKPSNLMFSIEKPLMEDEMSDNFEAEGKQDIPSLKSVGILLGIGALGAYLAPQGVRNFLNRLNK